MKVLVTGGAGYIGSVLVGDLLAEEYEVTVIDNLYYNQTSLTSYFSDPNFEFLGEDVTLLPPSFYIGYDFIIPLAAYVGAPLCDKLGEEKVRALNVNHIKDIIEGTRYTETNIIYPNSNSGYGKGLVEDGELVWCTENTPLNPISLYGTTKKEAEEAVLAANGISLRLATVFGMSPRPRLDLLVNNLSYRAGYGEELSLFEPHYKRNFIHVKDVSRAFCYCIEHFYLMRGEVYNLGLNEANLSKLELCEEIKKNCPGFTWKIDTTRKDPDQRNYIVSNKKIQDAGFYTRKTLSSGIKEILNAIDYLDSLEFKQNYDIN